MFVEKGRIATSFIDGQEKSSNDCQLLLRDLQNFIISSVYDFDNLNSSLQFIQANEWMKTFIIISGSLGDKYSHHYIGLPQVECLYVFCRDVTKHNE